MKAKKQQKLSQILAALALFAVIMGILGSGILVVMQSLGGANQTTLSQEELQEYLDSLPEVTSTGEVNATGESITE